MTMFEQGDFIEVNFDPTVGHEPQKRRPALVLSVGYFNNVLSSLAVVCPITSHNNGHPLHIELGPDNDVSGCVCIEQMRSIDLSNAMRDARHLGSSIDQATMSVILEAVGAIFDI